jgi:uncharacterized OsmC-like protein
MLSTQRPIVVTPEPGKRFTAQVRAHRLVLDQPIDEGGTDDGPSPIELLGVSLGSCIAHYVREFLVRRGYPADGMRVEVSQHGATNPARVSDFTVRVVLPMKLPMAFSELIERVATACPAHTTLVNGARVGVSIEMAKEPALAIR